MAEEYSSSRISTRKNKQSAWESQGHGSCILKGEWIEQTERKTGFLRKRSIGELDAKTQNKVAKEV